MHIEPEREALTTLATRLGRPRDSDLLRHLWTRARWRRRPCWPAATRRGMTLLATSREPLTPGVLQRAQPARRYFQRLMNPTAAGLTSPGFPALRKCLPSWTTRSSAPAELTNRLISSSALATEYTGSAVPCIHRTGHLTLSSRACRPSRSRRLTLLIRS